MRTRDKLASELRKIGTNSPADKAVKYEAFAKRAETGEFDDYADIVSRTMKQSKPSRCWGVNSNRRAEHMKRYGTLIVYLTLRNRTMSEISRCGLCGEPMPEGESMFKYHGYSGPCPKPRLPLPKLSPSLEDRVARLELLMAHLIPNKSDDV